MESTKIRNEQMIIDEARKFMEPAAQIKSQKPLKVPQQRITLSETGIRYDLPQISNRRQLQDFCQRLNEAECFEKFSIIAVDARCRPIGVYSIQGSLSEVSAYPRVVATFALLSNAHSVFFTHNHGLQFQKAYEPIFVTVNESFQWAKREGIDHQIMVKVLMQSPELLKMAKYIGSHPDYAHPDTDAGIHYLVTSASMRTKNTMKSSRTDTSG